MTIGSYALSSARVQAMAYTHSYMHNAFVFGFVQSTILTAPLTRLMAPFQSSVWISIVILVTISILAILMTKKLSARQRHFVIGGYMNRTPILNMLNVLIGSTIPNPRIAHTQYFGTFARTLAILWLFFTLVVRNSYQSSLYNFFQSHQTISSYDTVEKVRLSNVKINVIHSAIDLIPENFHRNR